MCEDKTKLNLKKFLELKNDYLKYLKKKKNTDRKISNNLLSNELIEDLKYFNLKESFTKAELYEARNIRLKECHPDKVYNMSKEIQKLAKEQTQKINMIFKRLEKYLNK